MSALPEPINVDVGFYASVDDIRAYIDSQKLQTLCDQTGVVAALNPALTLSRRLAHAEVISNLATIYGSKGYAGMPSELPSKVSELSVLLELAYVKFFLYDRKPEIAARVQQDGKYLGDLWTQAVTRMNRVKDSVQEFAPQDNPPGSPPSNVGGVTYDRSPRLYCRPGEPGDKASYGDL